MEDFYIRRYLELKIKFKKKNLYQYFYERVLEDGQCASPVFDIRYYLDYNDINSYAQELQNGKDYTVSLECYQKYVTLNLFFLIILFYF